MTTTRDSREQQVSGSIDRGEAARPTAPLETYVDAVAAEGGRFAVAIESNDLDAMIPTCPGWNGRDLVRHLGEIHLWAAANIAAPAPHWLQVDRLTDLAGHWPDLAARWPDDDDLIAWYRATLANLVHVFTTAPVDVQAFTFLPAPTPLVMWARRQASEIAIHRVDAELAHGITPQVETSFAADMLDELLVGFTPYHTAVDVSNDRVLQIVAADVGDQWWVTMGSRGVETARNGRRPDLTITGTAAELYLLLWNRTSESTVRLAGDVDLMDLWRATCRVEWGGG